MNNGNNARVTINRMPSAPTEWRGEAGVVGPFESRTVAQTFASFRVDFTRLIVERTFAKGRFWYLELKESLSIGKQ